MWGHTQSRLTAKALPEGSFVIYRKDAKGSAAHSVRDRLAALLAKSLRFAGAHIAPTPPRKRRALYPNF